MECQNQISSRIITDYLPDLDEGRFNSGFDKALVCLKNQQFEKAITLFEGSLLQAIKKYGENAPELAKFYFNLGSAMLSQIENSREIFAASVILKDQKANLRHESDPYNLEHIQNNSLDIIASEHSRSNSNSQLQGGITAIERQPEDPNSNLQSQDSVFGYRREDSNHEEDPEDIQLAWEHLELARFYTEMKLNSLKDQGKIEEISNTMEFLSVIHAKLGDLNSYQENFREAIFDYETCLNLRKFSEDHFYGRGIAEAYYLIGEAHLGINTKEADDIAILNFHKSRIIVENILSREFKQGVNKDPENKQEQKSVFRQEFLNPTIFEVPETKELKSILLDLYEKIDDTTQQANERDLVAADLTLNQNPQLSHPFGTSNSIFERLQEQPHGHQKTAALISKFDRLGSYSTQSNDTNVQQNSRPIQDERQNNSVKLGVFGNGAKKRSRQELQIIPEKSEDSSELQKSSLTDISQFENITKAGEFGKPEKMIKIN